MQGIDIRLRASCPRANRSGNANRDEDAHFARRQAFGLDDIDSPTHYVKHAAKTLFLVLVTLTEHKWVTLGERRGPRKRERILRPSGSAVLKNWAAWLRTGRAHGRWAPERPDDRR
jgi:hypothetical protein